MSADSRGVPGVMVHAFRRKLTRIRSEQLEPKSSVASSSSSSVLSSLSSSQQGQRRLMRKTRNLVKGGDGGNGARGGRGSRVRGGASAAAAGTTSTTTNSRRQRNPRDEVREMLSNRETMLDAVAFQDHLSRSLKLKLGSSSKRQERRRQRRTGNAAANRRERDDNEEDQESRWGAAQGESSRWQCSTCTLLNDYEARRCGACGDVRSVDRDSKAAELDSKIAEFKVDENFTNDAEDVVETRRKLRERVRWQASLSMAQRRGLVAKPPEPEPLLTKEQWEEVAKRSDERKDSSAPCAICREPFGVQAQVILSCTHVFHRACLASFERFVGSAKRACPICRKASYERRGFRGGLRAMRHSTATMAQAAARGYLARRRYEEIRRDLYVTKGGGDPQRRRKYLASRVSRAGAALADEIDREDARVDAVFAESERALEASRRAMRAAFDSGARVGQDNSTAMGSRGPWRLGDKMWEEVITVALQRVTTANGCDCPICLNPLSLAEDGGGAGATAPAASAAAISKEEERVTRGVLSVLSCSHVFHSACVRSFEEFNCDEVRTCPVCRSAYSRRELE